MTRLKTEDDAELPNVAVGRHELHRELRAWSPDAGSSPSLWSLPPGLSWVSGSGQRKRCRAWASQAGRFEPVESFSEPPLH